MSLPKDKLKWIAAAFALVATASAEYEIARAIGMNQWIAAAVPGALDAYAVRALRAHREVLTAVLAMVGVNAASHLVSAGVLHVGWPLITAVSAIAPLVLWRVHALSTPGEHRRRVLWGVPDPLADVPPVPEEHRSTPARRMQTCSVKGCQVWGDLGAHERAHELSGSSTPAGTVPDHVPDEWSHTIPRMLAAVQAGCTCEHEPDWHTEHGCIANGGACSCTAQRGGLDDEWSTDEHANVLPFRAPGQPASTTDTPVSERDRAALLVLRLHMADEHLSEVPGIRDIKKICKVSTDRARRVQSMAKGETQ